MNVRISVGKGGEEDIVTLQDRTRWTWSAWLNRTDASAKAVRAALDEQRITPEAQAGHAWLKRCGIDSRESFEDLEQRLPQLRLPADRSNTRRCTKCGNVIWGRMALLTGLGSACRRGSRKTARAMVHALPGTRIGSLQ